MKFSSPFVVAIILMCTNFFSHSIMAEILIEPHIGYALIGDSDYEGGTVRTLGGGFGGSSIAIPVGASIGKYNGFQYGAKLGLQYSGFMFGVDHNISNYTEKTTTDSGSDKDDYKRSETGLFAGYNFPLLFRAWAGYYIAKAKISEANSNTGAMEGDYFKGYSKEFGVGYTGLPYVSINLKYRVASYGEGDANLIGPYSIDPKADYKEIVLGLSLPVTF